MLHTEIWEDTHANRDWLPQGVFPVGEIAPTFLAPRKHGFLDLQAASVEPSGELNERSLCSDRDGHWFSKPDDVAEKAEKRFFIEIS